MSNYVRPGIKPVYKIRTVGSSFSLDKAMPHVAAAIEAQIDCDDAGDDFVKKKLHSNIRLCITIAANIADSGILSFDACFPDSVVGFIPATMFENARYFEYFVRTAKANLLEFAPATAQKNINLEILTQVLIPLPPLVEQQRIVFRVDELMSLCDRLEASLATTEDTRRRLLEALLAEALSPVVTIDREAAE